MLVSRQSSTLSTTSKDTSTSSTAGTATMFILAALNKILADKYVNNENYREFYGIEKPSHSQGQELMLLNMYSQ